MNSVVKSRAFLIFQVFEYNLLEGMPPVRPVVLAVADEAAV